MVRNIKVTPASPAGVIPVVWPPVAPLIANAKEHPPGNSRRMAEIRAAIWPLLTLWSFGPGEKSRVVRRVAGVEWDDKNSPMPSHFPNRSGVRLDGFYQSILRTR